MRVTSNFRTSAAAENQVVHVLLHLSTGMPRQISRVSRANFLSIQRSISGRWNDWVCICASAKLNATWQNKAATVRKTRQTKGKVLQACTTLANSHLFE
jgi:hypothetical protein